MKKPSWLDKDMVIHLPRAENLDIPSFIYDGGLVGALCEVKAREDGSEYMEVYVDRDFRSDKTDPNVRVFLWGADDQAS